ncbi:ABC transporter ATP-binding protein [Paraburkholderia nemoris]|uniref:ABC transporter ATP-binding protein n=1 Tax=Paraburkholderia nemoris TaxID=2793076 RepID=UPI0038B965F7
MGSKTVETRPMVEVRTLRKQYGDFVALNDVSLSIAKGEFVTLLGPSGSGKSTLLNLISGMATPTAGEIYINGEDATQLPTNRRGLGMVFQNYALMPHLTVFENIAFPLQVRRVPKAEIKDRVAQALKLIQLEHVAHRKPKELSGGQQQRISLARCFVYNPPLILMDEPLGALDKKLREDMQLEIKRLHAELGVTMLYVTHDQDEALTMSDRIVLMRGGAIEQHGTPDALYFRPETAFAAGFIGNSNLFAGAVETMGDSCVLRTGPHVLQLMPDPSMATPRAKVSLLVRPENVRLVTLEADSTGCAGVTVVVEDSILLGGVVRHYLRTPEGQVVIAQELNHPGKPKLARGTSMRAQWSLEDARLIPTA